MIYMAIRSSGYEDFVIRFVSQHRHKTESFIKKRYLENNEHIFLLALEEDESLEQHNFDNHENITDVCSIYDILNHFLGDEGWSEAYTVEQGEITIELTDMDVPLETIQKVAVKLECSRFSFQESQLVLHNAGRYQEESL